MCLELEVELNTIATCFERRYGHAVLCSWLRPFTTSRKLAFSIPDGVIGIFHWLNPSGRIIALGSAEKREIFSGLKGAGALG